MIGLQHYLAVGAALFILGMIGFLSRRNMIVMFLSAEMMLQGVAINFTAFSKHHGNMHGQVFTLFIVAVAACEAGIAMAMFIALYNRKKSLDVSVWQDIRESGLDPTTDPEPLIAEKEEPLPQLQVAGTMPKDRGADHV
jgi:NADH-quinone oxidoreductase subunit K